MRVLICVVGVLTVGCASVEVAPLAVPKPGEALTQGQIAGRVRAQVTAAIESYYRDDWDLLVRTSKDLYATVRLIEPDRIAPMYRDDAVRAKAAILTDSSELLKVADSRDVSRANEVLRKLHVQARLLPLE